MHRLLKRQLEKIYANDRPDDDKWRALVALIDEAYEGFEINDLQLQRALDISSNELNQRNGALSGLLDAFPDSTATFNRKLRLLEFRVGQGLERYESLVARRATVSDLPFISNPACFEEKLKQVQETKVPCHYEYQLTQHITDPKFIEARISPFDENKLLVVFRDITEHRMLERLRREAFDRINKTEKQLRKIIEGAPVGMVLSDHKGDIFLVNAFAQRYFDFQSDQLIGQNSQQLIALSQRERYKAMSEGVLNDPTQKFVRGDFEVITSNGSKLLADIGMSSLQYDDKHWVAHTFSDITKRKRLEAELRVLASTDPLTGALNRRQFMNNANQAFAAAQRHHRHVSILALDVDHFKGINDNYGHSVGDTVLIRLVDKIESMLRKQDSLGRVGGEEFAVLLPDTSSLESIAIAERIREGLSQMDVECDVRKVQFTVSIGVCANSPSVKSVENMLDLADIALYEAKRGGRNRVVEYQPPMAKQSMSV
ncbi:sensor domain-containing diguanylate cyclase [Enterovibrio sp. ZSDZ35]|uniref:Sensor domain-containing diguanylate cyclase n=1 Tax=Enterovibrio qingdaonensis TaxID=2899818 RepID=A0ABT5QT20_9GAMM|nr:sensor domain-containing diguanylate cyclase [Enterovibrio sp. ZSDZ35]MDD1783843.1 sensor domain-containing diguanylate cyclase [Enterovibrio sp. ZSDZ35]